MGRAYDMVLFGASGFTGKYVVEKIAELLRDGKVKPFTWAVAGRSTVKLRQVLSDASTYTGYDMKTSVKILEADLGHPQSIYDMAKQAKILLNCVGPYRFFGEVVIEACIEQGTHHLDISGEIQFLEKMQLLYHKKAEEKGVYIVGACGCDSIPTDLGLCFLRDKFNGDLNSVEMFLDIDRSAIQNTKVHYGTFESAIYVIANIGEMRTIRSQLFVNPLPTPQFPLCQRSFVHYNESVNGWCLPFIGSDKSIVERSERFWFETEGRRPVQINTFMKQDSLILTIFVIIGFFVLGVLAQFEYGRRLLLKYPRLCTLGFVSHEGPTRQQADFPFTFTLIGEGWKEKGEHAVHPNKRTTIKIRGRNLGYGTTATCLVQAGLTLLQESSKLPSTGGVYTTAAAFGKTTLVDRLNETGVTFEVDEKKES